LADELMGPAENIIITTARVNAVITMAICSAMPTAVTTESSEKDDVEHCDYDRGKRRPHDGRGVAFTLQTLITQWSPWRARRGPADQDEIARKWTPNDIEKQSCQSVIYC
jgi:hypothetical protein